MTKNIQAFLLILTVSLLMALATAGYTDDHFGRGFTKTQIIPAYQAKKQPQIQTPIPPTHNPAGAGISPVPTETHHININPHIPPPSTQTSQLEMLNKLKNPKITVPDFEQKYKDIIKALEEKAGRKKKKLSEILLEEIDRYGIYVNIVLIMLIVAYVVYKERIKTLSSGEPLDEKKGKDIWHEEF